MGLYNILRDKTPSGEIEIQFHWGYERMIEYQVGDNIDWGSISRPEIANNKIHIGGVSFQKSEGGITFDYYSIQIDNDIITGFDSIDEEHFEALSQAGFKCA